VDVQNTSVTAKNNLRIRTLIWSSSKILRNCRLYFDLTRKYFRPLENHFRLAKLFRNGGELLLSAARIISVAGKDSDLTPKSFLAPGNISSGQGIFPKGAKILSLVTGEFGLPLVHSLPALQDGTSTSSVRILCPGDSGDTILNSTSHVTMKCWGGVPTAERGHDNKRGP
jgi:hypothetical protein